MGKGFDPSVANDMLNNQLGAGAAGVMPSTVYIALSTADPGISGSAFAEPGGGIGYVRKPLNNTTDWNAASGGEKTNATAVTYDQATGSWGSIYAWGIYSALSGGTLLAWGMLDTMRTVNVNDQLQFGPGDLVLKLANQA